MKTLSIIILIFIGLITIIACTSEKKTEVQPETNNAVQKKLPKLRGEQERRINKLHAIIIKSYFMELEGARDIVQKEDLPYLAQLYNKLKTWDQRSGMINIVMDHFDDVLRPMMLDYLRAPYEKDGDWVELNKMVALSYQGEEYDKFQIYYNNFNLLYSDVNKVLKKNNLTLVVNKSNKNSTAAKPVNNTYNKEKSPEENLMKGIDAGDLDLVKTALTKGADINARLDNGRFSDCTALILAIMNDQYDIANYLIDKGADINKHRYFAKKPKVGQSPLWWAASKGNLTLLERLISLGAEVHKPDIHGSTPLMQAASKNSLPAFNFLIKHGATFTDTIYDGRRVINLAASKGRSEIVKRLLELGDDPNYCANNQYTPLMAAAANNNVAVARVLIKGGAKVNSKYDGYSNGNWKDYTPLVMAVINGNCEITQMLLEAGADVHYKVRDTKSGKVIPVIGFATRKRVAETKAILKKFGAEESDS